MYEKIKEAAANIEKELWENRQRFHDFPEQGWQEMRASVYIADYLKKLEFQVLQGDEVHEMKARMGVPSDDILQAHKAKVLQMGVDSSELKKVENGNTGVIGILKIGDCSQKNKVPTIALRFDMDALEAGKPAHLCGHDGHMAIGLGVARVLSQLQKEWLSLFRQEGSHICDNDDTDILEKTKSRDSGVVVKLIFQPAEEGVRGAKSIVEKGHLEGVDYLLGIHIQPSLKTAICTGMTGTYATTKFDVVFHGKAAHAAAAPEQGRNALLAAASAVTQLYAIPRHSQGDSIINVGTFQADTGRNVICDQAVLKLETRGKTSEINEYMEKYARNILEHTAAIHGCTCEIVQVGSAPSIKSSIELRELTGKVAGKLGYETLPPEFWNVSEDFAYMAQEVLNQGGKTNYIGARVPCSGPLHSENFTFDKQALEMGVQTLTGLIMELV